MSSQPANLERRAAILGAARTVFLRWGFKDASMEDIARGAGVELEIVSMRFESKEGLFGAVIEQLGEHITPHLAHLRAREARLLEAILVEGNATGAFKLNNPEAVALAMVGCLQNREQVQMLFYLMSRVERVF